MQPVTVSAVRPEMHLDRNARAFQREIPRKCVLNADAVILRLNQERGRNIRIDFEFRRKIQLQIRKIRGIDQRGEVRAVRECVDFIRRRIRNRIRRCGNRRAKVRPAEKPIAPTLSGMMSKFSAFARIMRIARAASA